MEEKLRNNSQEISPNKCLLVFLPFSAQKDTHKILWQQKDLACRIFYFHELPHENCDCVTQNHRHKSHFTTISWGGFCISIQYLSTDEALCNLLPKQTEHLKFRLSKSQELKGGMSGNHSSFQTLSRKSHGVFRCVCHLRNETANGSNCE